MVNEAIVQEGWPYEFGTSGFCETWPVAQDIQHSYCGIHEEIRLFLWLTSCIYRRWWLTLAGEDKE
ncbi:hypothetical protein CNC02685 [Cryptococcus deneoformans JEC21]|uniref:Uncharacterized protein n=1 Tax=Cryptococcus deneoformans (strain JEC21 / ATCC MYA-565) TaxID=214684 RepID=A0A0S2LIT5_CRYD1|nr:hypothetical protein CNC02685 [Cryptococcus neoformans var. neoformans JEC21]ALO60462.1 hypothetical protein CNC02685 [Cryptococcus neoformans var. neoformans JEC21]